MIDQSAPFAWLYLHFNEEQSKKNSNGLLKEIEIKKYLLGSLILLGAASSAMTPNNKGTGHANAGEAALTPRGDKI